MDLKVLNVMADPEESEDAMPAELERRCRRLGGDMADLIEEFATPSASGAPPRNVPPTTPDDPYASYSREALISLFEKANATALAREEEVHRLNLTLEAQRKADARQLEKERSAFRQKLAATAQATQTQLNDALQQLEKHKRDFESSYAARLQQAVARAAAVAGEQAKRRAEAAAKAAQEQLDNKKKDFDRAEIERDLAREDASDMRRFVKLGAIGVAVVFAVVFYYMCFR